MKPINDFPTDGIPLLGQPKIRTVFQAINPVQLVDKDGTAVIKPLDDITPIELYQVMLTLCFLMMQPKGVLTDQKGQPFTYHTQWREHIVQHKLERHFEFAPHANVAQGGTT